MATVTEAVAILFTAFGKAEDVNRQTVYVMALNNIQPELLIKACNVLMTDSKFLPTIAEIVETAKAVNADKNRELPAWSEAWAEIQKQVHDAFVYKKPVFSCPEIEQAAIRFGWMELCEAKTDDMPTIHAQVRRIYEDICNRAEEQRKYGLLARNDVAGYITGQPVKADKCIEMVFKQLDNKVV